MKTSSPIAHNAHSLHRAALVAIAVWLLLPAAAGAQEVAVHLKPQAAASDDSLVRVMSRNLSKVLAVANTAYRYNRPVSASELPMDGYAQGQLEMLWTRWSFQCDSTAIHSRIWTARNGYMVRAVPITAKNRDSRNVRTVHLWLAVEFNSHGIITDIKFASSDIGEEFLANSTSVSNLLQQVQMLQYTDRYLTAFYIEDANFFEQLLGNDALVVVGKEIRRRKGLFNRKGTETMEYRDSYRRDYLSKIQRAFNKSTWVSASMQPIVDSDGDTLSHITQSLSNSHFYGVRLQLKWESQCGYSEQGYALLLWDFTDIQQPLIHVRTWQPAYVFGRPLNATEIFSLSDFGY